jgi:hypothetical protein
MISLWPFHHGGRVMDLKAPQIAEAALKSFQQMGRAPASLRLLYRTLELDSYHPNALLLMIEIFHGHQKGTRPKGDEIYSGIILEYAMDAKNPLPHEKKALFDKTRLEIMTAWGFVTNRAGEAEVDHLGYMGYISDLLHTTHSVTNAFGEARKKLGIQAGVVDRDKGTPTHSYQQWLHSDASKLHL